MSPRELKPYWSPYLAGALLGVVLFLSFFLTGGGLGGSGGFLHGVAWLVHLLTPSAVEHNPYWAEQASGAAVSILNHRLVWGAVGVAIGGLASGWLGGRLKVEVLRGPSIGPRLRLAAALLGGVLEGYAARLARGCTSGQALSGGAVLSAGSWAFMFAVFGGGYALAYFCRKLWR
ncbi:MAG: YeeE/YedE thiosulfate transporter family protein [Pseudomonadota bacterium]